MDQNRTLSRKNAENGDLHRRLQITEEEAQLVDFRKLETHCRRMELELQDLRKMKETFGPITAAERKQQMDTTLKLNEVTRDFQALEA